ncbi:MAG: PstS family phosphate ABC transporter substrate-binding protein [Armatimonadota bacterium]|nr:PstS family phosphate ABC transporter substrate-binding protein [Armatimonadota bacterium]
MIRSRCARAAAAAAFLLAASLGLAGGSPATAGQLTVKGSDTMVILAQAWAERFMQLHPGHQVAVTGGGSGTGIAALINGTTDLANCSREMKKSEIDKCKDRGFVPVPHTVALDGISIAVHASNPVRSLSLDQLYGIYTGKITDWAQVGGKPGKIIVLSRESNSGTYVYFRDFVLKRQNYRPDALLMPSTNTIQQEISKNPNAIGYGGRAYFEGKPNVKVIPVSAKTGGPAIEPTDENVRNKKYPIARPLFIYSKGAPSGLAKQFIDFAKSPEGQSLVNKVGYVSLK